MVLVRSPETAGMKKDNKPVEKKLGNTRQSSDHTSVRKNIDPLRKKEIKEKDKTENFGGSEPRSDIDE